MAFEKNYDVELPVTQPPCIHLRSKAMYVTGSRQDTGDPHDADNENCWCNMTQHIIGPDDQSVERAQCIPGRTCYRETL